MIFLKPPPKKDVPGESVSTEPLPLTGSRSFGGGLCPHNN